MIDIFVFGIMLAELYPVMKKKNQHIILTAILAIIVNMVFGYHMANADDISASDVTILIDTDEAALAELINAARRDPLGTAETLGMNREDILNDLPELSEILLNGLPELVINARLCQTAGGHTLDMLENNFYAYESVDGKSPEQRMTEAGYVASAAGEALGLIFFNNFIDSDQAVFQIFENMFKDELSPGWSGPRNILNPDFVDLGVGIGGGLYQLNEISGNVYLATCDFGASVETYELQLLTLINQLRNNPAAVTRFFDITVSKVLDLFPEYSYFYASGLSPLAFSGQLYAAAEVHINDMVTNNYWGHVSPEGITPVMRIREQGYVPIWAGESKSRLSTCDNDISPASTVAVIFKNMFFNAFKRQGFRDDSMLAEKALESGLRIIAAESNVLSGICGDNVHISVGDFGTSADYNGPVLTGVIYNDFNANGLYDAGEGVFDVAVTIKSVGIDGVSKTIKTNAAGGYAAFLAAGRYRVSAGMGDNEKACWITMETASIWKPFALTTTAPVLTIN